MKKTSLFFAFALLLAAPARAQTPAQVEQAKALFNAGAQAYGIGQYLAAIQAFEEAYKITPKPPILFSLAQAERKQYFVDHQPDHLQKAVEGFRKYVEQVPQGGRRADAVQALSELEPLLAQQKAAGMPAPAAAPAAKTAARVMVTSPTPGAQVSLDGASSSEAPFIGEVKPGKHVVEVVAKGHDPEKRDIQVVEGGMVALDLPLKEKPALLSLKVESGAEISVDGRVIGTSPLSGPIPLSHGRHYVTVMKNGHLAWARDVDVVRGETQTLEPTLITSAQRKVSYVVLGTSAAAFLTGGAFVLLTLDRQSKAQNIFEEREKGTVTSERLAEYDSLRSSRDRFRTWSTVAFGGGAVLAVSGLLLYALDRPSAPARDMSPGEKSPAPQPKSAPLEMGATPLVTPTFVGGSFAIAF